MNDTAIDPGLDHRFKVAVEHAVRPLAATLARKRLLREELLAHLHSVYHDVLLESSNAAEAGELALARFGDPLSLTRELQTSVPRSDRLLSRIQWTPQPADLTPWGLLRWMLVFAVGFNAILFAMLGVLQWLEIGRPQSSPFFGLIVMAVCGVAAFYPFLLIAIRLGELSLAQHLGWNRESLRLALAASACFPIWLTLVYCGLSGELVIPWGTIGPAYVAGFLFGPVVALVQGRRLVEDRRYLHEWASLIVED